MYTKKGGFTLIELMATIVLMGIISVMVGHVLLNGYQNFITSQTISQTDWKGLLVLERMSNDIHTIRSANDISIIGANQLVFIDVNSNTVQYQLSGNSLLRNSQTLVNGIQSFNLSYLDKNGSVTAVPSFVRYVLISVAIAQDNLAQSYSTMAATRGML